MRRVLFTICIILIGLLTVLISFNDVEAATYCYCGTKEGIESTYAGLCVTDTDCTTGGGRCEGDCVGITSCFHCTGGTYDDQCVSKTSCEAAGGTSVDAETLSFFEEVFGPNNLLLSIFRPINYWQGNASLWSIFAMVLSFAFPVLFIAFIVVIAIATIKWVSSQGREAEYVSAQKWMKNAFYGFFANIFVFVGVNIITWWIGIGNIFSLAQNLATCEDINGKKVVLFEFKKDGKDTVGTKIDINLEYDCVCQDETSHAWSCTLVVK